MRRRSTLPVVLLLALGGVSACAEGSDSSSDKASSSASPTASGSDASSASSSPSESDSSSPRPSARATTPVGSATASAGGSGFPHDRIEAASMHKAVLVQSSASTAEQRAVVDAWMGYWQGAADTYYLYRPTAEFLASSSGTARSSVLGYLGDKKQAGQRVVGWARDHVTSVKVTGDRATVRDCTENYTYSVDRESEPLTKPPPYYDVTGTLEKQGGRWVVVKQTSAKLGQSCL